MKVKIFLQVKYRGVSQHGLVQEGEKNSDTNEGEDKFVNLSNDSPLNSRVNDAFSRLQRALARLSDRNSFYLVHFVHDKS